jgi:hypothetical protein
MESNYELIKNEEHKQFIDDYYNFDLDDIELYRLLKTYETLLSESEANVIKEDVNRFVEDFKTNPFTNFSFPYLKGSILPMIEKLFIKYNNGIANYYFLIDLLGSRKDIYSKLRDFYIALITQNNFGISSNISDAITKEARDSKEYNNFVKMLAEWYTLTEMIMFYVSIQNLFLMKNEVFVFETKNYSPETNFNFSMSSFAKRSLLKLVSYLCKHSQIATGTLDIDKLMIFVLSAVTCGITMKNLFTGLTSCAFLVI